MRFKAANPDDPELVRAAEVATVLVNEFYAFGDGDGSAPILESMGMGPTRNISDRELDRQIFEDTLIRGLEVLRRRLAN